MISVDQHVEFCCRTYRISLVAKLRCVNVSVLTMLCVIPEIMTCFTYVVDVRCTYGRNISLLTARV